MGSDAGTHVERTFAFVDLAGFTALTEAHGDHEAMATVRAFRDRTLATLDDPTHLVKVIGDAVMLAFPDPDVAVRSLCRLLGPDAQNDAGLLRPRAGVHHGTAVYADGDYYGAGVNLAARVADEARGGQLLATSDVALAARDQGVVVSHLGAVVLRNISAAVDLWELRLHAGTEPTAIDPVCAMQVPTSAPEAVSLAWSDRRAWFCSLGCASRFAAEPGRFADRLMGPEVGGGSGVSGSRP